ncbi:hypothetical protein GCM10017673_11050 [Streptosporangium violaceochromogenes]|nr:hypothetical protein GCM10017673_11050 [Streptosporangium violaceochromogenes]
MTPSRKPSRATVITASVAIGVFGAGVGLGTVIASRSQAGESEAMRLAAGTYHLDDGAQAWKPKVGGGGNEPVPLSGLDAGSTITGGQVPKIPKLCLTATADGHVTGGAGGCAALPVLASAIAPMQRPGNPKSTATATPKKESTPAKTSAPEQAPERRKGGGGGGGQSAPDPARPAPVQPPVQPPQATHRPTTAPAPTKKVGGDISESGSLIDRPAEKPKLAIDARPKPLDDRGVKQANDPQNPPKQAQPSGTLKPALPNGTAKPTAPPSTAKPVPPQVKAPLPQSTPKSSGTAKQAPPVPSGTLKPALPTAAPRPVAPSASAREERPPVTAPDHRDNRAPGGTVLRPSANGTLPKGADSLPVFDDPELLRRAQEALGLDKNMRYTDENGVWDLNIAPPGTPPCRDYSADELRELGSSDGAAIPRDSCMWPAFVRWLYADPAPGEVSNWTKFTGLSERNLEFVVTDPAAEQPGTADQTDQPDQTGQFAPAQPEQPGTADQGDPSGQSSPSDGFAPAQPSRPDHSSRFEGTGRFDPGQAARPDRQGSARPDRHRAGQVEPESDGRTGR